MTTITQGPDTEARRELLQVLVQQCLPLVLIAAPAACWATCGSRAAIRGRRALPSPRVVVNHNFRSSGAPLLDRPAHVYRVILMYHDAEFQVDLNRVDRVDQKNPANVNTLIMLKGKPKASGVPRVADGLLPATKQIRNPNIWCSKRQLV
jgi:hypothetical protein